MDWLEGVILKLTYCFSNLELSDADSVGSMVAAAAPMAIGENTSDVENSDYSDMEDLSSRSAESEGETNQTSAKEKEKSQTVKQAVCCWFINLSVSNLYYAVITIFVAFE